MVVDLESREAKKLSLLPSTLSLMVTSSGTTTGRTFRLWGAMGVIMKLLALGTMIGPPQLREYAVDPVGVEIIKPSAQ